MTSTTTIAGAALFDRIRFTTTDGDTIEGMLTVLNSARDGMIAFRIAGTHRAFLAPRSLPITLLARVR
jgi:hypothetical protein